MVWAFNKEMEYLAVKTRLSLIIIYVGILLSGCSTTPEQLEPQQQQQQEQGLEPQQNQDVAQTSPVDTEPHQQKVILSKLATQHQEWEGTKYLFGGITKQGVDCSAFVYLTYLDKFSIQLARTTHRQSKQGISISKQELKPGDLVFFKTDPLSRHVGIYLGNNQFLHSSGSKGVIISDLNNDYWSNTYWQARRIPVLWRRNS